MKNTLIFMGLVTLLLGVAAFVALAGESANPSEDTLARVQAKLCPIAAGVWYPGDGKVPEKPVRYYRARCWPGCHSGSSYGLYPEDHLNDQPIWQTSTVTDYDTIPAHKVSKPEPEKSEEP
jgi:hypothetical protein